MAKTKQKIGLREVLQSIAKGAESRGSLDDYICNVAPVQDAGEQSLSLCSDTTEKAKQTVRESRARAIICSKSVVFDEEDYQGKTLLLVDDPKRAFAEVVKQYFAERIEFGISASAVVDTNARIHPHVYIGPHCTIGECEIGEGTIIYGNVYIYPNVRIGRNVVINAGTVIGAEGILTTWDVRLPHTGGVVIEDNVQIGSNVSIMKGMLSNTIIGEWTTVGHLCTIGHQAVIGKHCMIVTHSVIGGSCHIGDRSQISLCACIRDKVRIGSKVTVGMGSVVTKDVGDGWVVFGVPARKVREIS